ncbi:MAG TPA: hypothetical protein VNA69_05435 [Thermoanaerobaculia bacterium]|nr:hypothetical protein [Thermoanaerobaculia bacterium]
MSDFLIAVTQLLLSLLAGAGLFFLWRRVAGKAGIVFWLVTLGTLGRAVAGQTLFWISFLGLPIAPSLQAGNGFWFFALDGIFYYDLSTVAASEGPRAIVTLDAGLASVFYVKMLATCVYLFGASPAVALLMNLAAYLGTCGVILTMGGAMAARGRVLGIAALTFAPSIVIWSLQPLKDSVFLFIVALFILAADRWQKEIREPQSGARGVTTLLWTAAIMTVALYAISSIRWYFSLFIIAASVPFFVAAILRASHRLKTTIAAALFLPWFFAITVVGAGPYLPASIRAMIAPRKNARPAAAAPLSIARDLSKARSGFDRSKASTLIGVGPALSPAAKKPAARAAPAAARTTAPKETVAADVQEIGDVVLPRSHATRLIAGTVALVLPRALAARLGLIDVRGGRGLWLVAEIDTLIFDVVLLYAIYCLFGSIRSGGLREPSFWLVFFVTILIAGSLVYMIANFGTLFRHRNMVYLGLVLLPLTVAGAATRRRSAALAEVDPIQETDGAPLAARTPSM